MSVGQPTKRPGGRTAETTRRVADAVVELLLEGGIAGCTFAAVAARAGVERSTLYRRYEDRWMMIMDATIASVAAITSDSSGSFATDLKAILSGGAETLSGPFGQVVLGLAAALRGTMREFHIHRFWESRMQQIEPMFEAAIARGELAEDVDRIELFTFAAGPLYFRSLFTAQPVDEAWIDRIVGVVCDRYCVGRSKRRQHRRRMQSSGHPLVVGLGGKLPLADPS